MGEDIEISIRRKVVYKLFEDAQKRIVNHINDLFLFALDFHMHSTSWSQMKYILTSEQMEQHVVSGTKLYNLLKKKPDCEPRWFMKEFRILFHFIKPSDVIVWGDYIDDVKLDKLKKKEEDWVDLMDVYSYVIKSAVGNFPLLEELIMLGDFLHYHEVKERTKKRKIRNRGEVNE